MAYLAKEGNPEVGTQVPLPCGHNVYHLPEGGVQLAIHLCHVLWRGGKEEEGRGGKGREERGGRKGEGGKGREERGGRKGEGRGGEGGKVGEEKEGREKERRRGEGRRVGQNLEEWSRRPIRKQI